MPYFKKALILCLPVDGGASTIYLIPTWRYHRAICHTGLHLFNLPPHAREESEKPFGLGLDSKPAARLECECTIHNAMAARTNAHLENDRLD